MQTKGITLCFCFYSSDTFTFSSSNMKRSPWQGLQVQIYVSKIMLLKSWWSWWKSYLLSLLMMILMMFVGSDSLSWLQPRPAGLLPASTWGGWDFLHQTFASEEKHQTILTWGDQSRDLFAAKHFLFSSGRLWRFFPIFFCKMSNYYISPSHRKKFNGKKTAK